MLLSIDIGNSNSKFGLFENGKLTRQFFIETKRNQSPEDIFSQIKNKINGNLSAIIISTVVKELKETYNLIGENLFGQKPFFVDHTSDFGFSIEYVPPENCGSDRLVAAFAAVRKYGKPVIVCDFGTATNIEVVNRKNQYLGGVITPGPNTLGSILFEKTSKLPRVEFEKPATVIGKSTVGSIQSGIYFGYIGLVDGIIKRIKKELGENARIISTGGFAEIIAKDSKYVSTIEKNLVLEGLFFLHQKMNVNP